MNRIYVLACASTAFALGALAAHVSRPAYAATPGPKAQIIDVGAMTDADLGAVVPHFTSLRTKMLVSTPQGAIAVQTGDVPKHTHADSLEIQYIVSGSGTFWLGNKMRHIHAGDLIIVPKGTPHAGSHAIGGEIKAISIKMPPPVAGDYHPVK